MDAPKSARKGPGFRLDLSRSDLPPLPIIENPEVNRRVFMHRSYYARPTHIFEDPPNDPSPDNEMLEHLGDSVLSLVITTLLRGVYPYLRVGSSTKIRALLVGNSTLASISLMYKLPERLITHPAQTITLRASTHIQADLFESYVGGVYEVGGLALVQSWLYPLFRPYIDQAYRCIRVQHGLPEEPEHRPPVTPTPGPKLAEPLPPLTSSWSSPAPGRQAPSIGHLSLFNQHLQQERKSVEWVYIDSAHEGSKTTPIWAVRAMLQGQCLGRGKGNTKKAAKNEAAKEGLQTLGVAVPRTWSTGFSPRQNLFRVGLGTQGSSRWVASQGVKRLWMRFQGRLFTRQSRKLLKYFKLG